MSRRVTLPSADDLFRPTGDEQAEPAPAKSVRAVPDAPEGSDGTRPDDTRPAGPDRAARPRPSGRVRHDEKMTVYVTSEELLEIERARLTLRGAHGLAVARGRLVREALALVLADLERHGEESALVRRLAEG